jgi:hypothetical protein
MSTTTMPAALAKASHTRTSPVSQITPMLLAFALLMACGVISVLLTGPMP